MDDTVLNDPIVILGTGASGIISAHVLIRDGYKDVTLISKDRTTGGVWARERVYEGLRTNTVNGEYRFAAMDMVIDKEGREEDARLLGTDICKYMEEYVERYLNGRVKFVMRHEVTKVWRKDDGMWRVRVVNMDNETTEEMSFKRVILATGGTSTPNIPEKLGQSVADSAGFLGRIFHSSDYAQEEPSLRLDPDKPKSCVVIGGGRSAQDLSRLMVKQGYDVTIVYQQLDVYFASTRPLPGSIRKSRLISVLSPHRKLDTRLERFLHTTSFGASITRKFWEMIVKGSLDACQVPPNSPLRLTHDAFWSLRNNDEGIPRPDGFHAFVNQGRIKVEAPFRAAGYDKDGVVLSDGRVLKADVVILATGYGSSWGMFDDETAEELGLRAYKPSTGPNDQWKYASLRNPPEPHPERDGWTVSFYRGIVPAKNILRRDFAIIGAMHTVHVGYTNELAAHWVASYFRLDPMHIASTVEEAVKEGEMVADFMKLRFPETCFWKNECARVTPDGWTWPQAIDELLEDMHLPTYRSGGNWLTWLFKPMSVEHIVKLTEERRAVRELHSSSKVD